MVLSDLLRMSLTVFLTVLAILIAYQMLTGRINLRGLLSDKKTGAFSPGRLQLLMLTVAGALALVQQGSADHMTTPDWIVALVAGSNGVYLTGKSISHFGIGRAGMFRQSGN